MNFNEYELSQRVSKILGVPGVQVIKTPFVELMEMLCDKVELEQAKREISENIVKTIDKFLEQERGY